MSEGLDERMRRQLNRRPVLEELRDLAQRAEGMIDALLNFALALDYVDEATVETVAGVPPAESPILLDLLKAQGTFSGSLHQAIERVKISLTERRMQLFENAKRRELEGK
jgi:hypothetical protein